MVNLLLQDVAVTPFTAATCTQYFHLIFLLFFAILSSEKYMLSITGGVCFMRLLIAEDEKSLSRALAGRYSGADKTPDFPDQ